MNEPIIWKRRSTPGFESEIDGSLYVIMPAEMDSHGGRKKKVWWLYKDGQVMKACSWKPTAQLAKDWLADKLEKRNEDKMKTDTYGRPLLAPPTVEAVATDPFLCSLNWELGEGVSEFVAVTQRLSDGRVYSYYALYISDEEKTCGVGFYENAFTTCGHGDDRFLRWEGPRDATFLEAMRAAELHYSTVAQKG